MVPWGICSKRTGPDTSVTFFYLALFLGVAFLTLPLCPSLRQHGNKCEEDDLLSALAMDPDLSVAKKTD